MYSTFLFVGYCAAISLLFSFTSRIFQVGIALLSRVISLLTGCRTPGSSKGEGSSSRREHSQVLR